MADVCSSTWGSALGTSHVCTCAAVLDHEWHWCPCGTDWPSEQANAYLHEHAEDDDHEGCTDCASLDPMRLCQVCLTYMAEDQR